jgi:hypothetical protein
MVTDEFRELKKKQARHRYRERKKREKSSARKERERQRDRGRESGRESERARFLAIAFWWRSDNGLYTAAQGPSPPPPTYSDVRVLENYYLNKYIHGGKFETSFFNKFFLI